MWKIGISGGEGGGYILGADFGKSRGEGGHIKNPFRGWGTDIFWNHTFIFDSENLVPASHRLKDYFDITDFKNKDPEDC